MHDWFWRYQPLNSMTTKFCPRFFFSISVTVFIDFYRIFQVIVSHLHKFIIAGQWILKTDIIKHTKWTMLRDLINPKLPAKYKGNNNTKSILSFLRKDYSKRQVVETHQLNETCNEKSPWSDVSFRSCVRDGCLSVVHHD